MDLRSLGLIGCRLLALYVAVLALSALPAPMVALLRTDSAAWPAVLAPVLLAVVAAALWFGAPWLAPRIVAPVSRVRSGGADGETLARAVFVAAGVLMLAASLDGLWQGVHLTLGALRTYALPPVSADTLGAIIAAPLRIGLGLVLLFGARPFAERLRVRDAAPPQPVDPAGSEDASVGRLLGELVGAAGALGVRQITDLVQTLRTEAEDVAKRVVRSSLDRIIAVAEERRPDFLGATSATGEVTIVFSDMEGFSAMTQRLGDRAAHKVIQVHNRVVRRAVKTHGGREVELQGDGFLLAFPDAAQALRCTRAIQRDFAAYGRKHPQQPIRVRIGVHSGKPIKEGDRFFGITVILAARIAAQAAGGETLVSQAVREQFADDSGFRFDSGRSTELKGLTGTHHMYALR